MMDVIEILCPKKKVKDSDRLARAGKGPLVGVSHADEFKMWRVENVGSCFDVCYLFFIQKRYATTSDLLARECDSKVNNNKQ